MSLDQNFEEATTIVRSLTKRPSNEELLELYALYKQATVGDNDTSRPGMMDQKGRAKWDAWNSKKGMSQNVAKDAYVKHVNVLLEKYK